MNRLGTFFRVPAIPECSYPWLSTRKRVNPLVSRVGIDVLCARGLRESGPRHRGVRRRATLAARSIATLGVGSVLSRVVSQAWIAGRITADRGASRSEASQLPRVGQPWTRGLTTACDTARTKRPGRLASVFAWHGCSPRKAQRARLSCTELGKPTNGVGSCPILRGCVFADLSWCPASAWS